MIKKKRLLHYRVASFFMFAYLEYSFNRVDFASSMICFQSLAKFPYPDIVNPLRHLIKLDRGEVRCFTAIVKILAATAASTPMGAFSTTKVSLGFACAF